MKKSKFFRVFTEGDTTDGREIQRNWIEEIAESYNTAKYGARIWLEHIRGILPDSPFKAYGDVTAVKAEKVEDGKLALFAQISPTEDLLAMNKARQKIYTSVEIDPNFAKTGKCYLTGLAVTDSPASLGTEMLAFSAKSEHNPLASRKQKPDNLFTAAVETTLEFEDDEPQTSGLFNRVKALLGKASKVTSDEFSDVHQAVEAIAQTTADVETRYAQLQQQFTRQQTTLSQVTTELEQLTANFNTLKQQLDNEPGHHSQRQPASGGDNTVKTDC
ncbi:GPO family capsid scaffolding protein [Shewanella dokdonensis]|uniref:GPO family capsid scaffolding protein n=1 Tax=Shewanella dokdonensis TaxID=712036 RepID=UPI00200E7AC0|nr:GPO family capsid scaffolding protein [Shewanella dokdonensis]MCL1074817.1 GPO family capsid scaffolding protein [Shewanella dokdonensis]